MSTIADLVAARCPSGVEFLKVGQLAQVGTGSYDRQDAIDGGEYPFYVRSKNVMRIGSYEFDEQAIVIPGEGGIGEIFHYVDGRYALHQRAYRIHFIDPRVDVKFAYYYFTANFGRFIQEKAVSSTVISIRKPMITDFPLPVPPIDVQRAIVEVLDTLSNLESDLKVGLEEEMEARGKQYAFYCSQILDNIGDTRVPLANLGKWRGGLTPSKNESRYWVDGETPWLASMDISDESTDEIRGRVTDAALQETSLTVIPAPSVVVVMRSNILRRRLPIGLVKVDTTVNQDIRALIPRDGVDAEYVYQVLRAESQEIRRRCVRADGSMAAVSPQEFLAWRIPLPSLSEQRLVANELRTFELLKRDLTSTLPAEISARKQQYQHYRDELLRFEDLHGNRA